MRARAPSTYRARLQALCVNPENASPRVQQCVWPIAYEQAEGHQVELMANATADACCLQLSGEEDFGLERTCKLADVADFAAELGCTDWQEVRPDTPCARLHALASVCGAARVR